MTLFTCAKCKNSDGSPHVSVVIDGKHECNSCHGTLGEVVSGEIAQRQIEEGVVYTRDAKGRIRKVGYRK